MTPSPSGILCFICKDAPQPHVCDACGNGLVPDAERRVPFSTPRVLERTDNLPTWFYADSPLTMDAIIGPDAQYAAGARDMLTVFAEVLLSQFGGTGQVSLNNVRAVIAGLAAE